MPSLTLHKVSEPESVLQQPAERVALINGRHSVHNIWLLLWTLVSPCAPFAGYRSQSFVCCAVNSCTLALYCWQQHCRRMLLLCQCLTLARVVLACMCLSLNPWASWCAKSCWHKCAYSYGELNLTLLSPWAVSAHMQVRSPRPMPVPTSTAT